MNENSSKQIQEEGNTKTSSCKQISPAKRWVFVLNNYTEEQISSIVPCFNKNVKYGGFCKEVGESGTPHLQGYVEFIDKIRPMSLKLTKNIHWGDKDGKPCKGDRESNMRYISKSVDYDLERLDWKKGVPKPIKIIKDLYDWQLDIEKLCLTEPNDRTVNWFWNASGNIGKSAFIKYMVVKYKVLFCSGGKYTDIMNLVFNQDMDECSCVLFDIPRANMGKISYASLESIKNGMVCNTKYETGVKVFNSPHVIVFANFEPEDPDMLSKDRWNIIEL